MTRIFATIPLHLIASVFAMAGGLDNLAASPLPPPLKPDITVAQDGSGNFESLQAAIDSVPKGNTERTILFIKTGTYNEHIRVEHSFLTFLGEDRDKTRIVWEINDPRKEPDGNADGKGIASFNLHNASDIVIANLTIHNPADLGLKPMVVFSSGQGTRIVIQNAEITGFGGDTLSLWTGGMYYHRNIHVTGTYHFVGPRGTCYMSDSLLEELGSVRNALFNEGRHDEREKFVLHRCRILSKEPFGLGSSFRDAAWYFVDCQFPDTLKPDGRIFIQQSNPSNPRPVSAMFQWPTNRIYFANSTGPNYPWLEENIRQSPARSSSAITAAWTFYGQWDPESTLPPGITSIAHRDKSVSLQFSESVTVKGNPMVILSDGTTASYVSGSGTDTLTFKAASDAPPETLDLNEAVILASNASAHLRCVEDSLTLVKE